jgi:rRNA maturation RNase YbeY
LWIKNAIIEEGFLIGNINVILTSDEKLLDTNKKFLNHDYYTDIITFNSNIKNRINGDLFISIDRVNENALHYSVNIVDELKRVIIHGILHLLGYDDKTIRDKVKMTERENKYLNLF